MLIKKEVSSVSDLLKLTRISFSATNFAGNSHDNLAEKFTDSLLQTTLVHLHTHGETY